MKKTYITPENTVVRLNVEQMVCESYQKRGETPYVQGAGNGTSDIIDADNLGREAINTPDAWDNEW